MAMMKFVQTECDVASECNNSPAGEDDTEDDGSDLADFITDDDGDAHGLSLHDYMATMDGIRGAKRARTCRDGDAPTQRGHMRIQSPPQAQAQFQSRPEPQSSSVTNKANAKPKDPRTRDALSVTWTFSGRSMETTST